uniref:FHA domain-containing protein n=1 Tax=Desulfobacca acetoxidans TaxID=60893 RepID=A0A7V4LDI0_9BACT
MTLKLKRCNAGHYYDPTIDAACPFCAASKPESSTTRPLKEPREATAAPEGVTYPQGQIPRGQPGGREQQEGVTVGYFPRKIGIDPVVGWLVCIAGPDRGRDFRLHSERNFIGRSEKMDVCIRGDNGISRENHAIVTFDPRSHSFRLQPGDGRALVYHNGQGVDISVDLKPYDIIELGETRLQFVPFCGEQFRWEQWSVE